MNSSEKLSLPENIVSELKKKQYGVYNHSAVQICTWNKKALIEGGTCYKEKFYGVDCHSCMQFSPVAMWCQQNCTFCWRPMEYMKNITIKYDDVDAPNQIVDNLVVLRQKLVSGFKGNSKISMEKWNESLVPTHYAISLSGEPTLYPRLNEMVMYLKSLERTKTIFIVSNGQEPEYFKNLINDEKSMPTQLYLSIDAPTKALFKKINCPVYPDGWERLNMTLSYFSKIKTRRVFRMTQIKGLNDVDELIDDYNKMIELGKPDIIEVKAYMHIGCSRNRHTKDQMPFLDDVERFARKLEASNPNYTIMDVMEESRIVVMLRIDSAYTLKIQKYENQ